MTNEEIAKKIAELETQNAALSAEIAALREKSGSADIPEKPRKPMPRFDPTEGMSMPPSAVKAMCDVFPDRKDQKFSAHAWSQTHMGSPGGFGPPPGGNWD